MFKLKKRILHGQVKKKLFDRQIVLSFRRHFAPVTGQFFAPSLCILYATVLLNISVANSHATPAYECESFAVTWHYLPSVRLDNARSVILL